MKSKPIIMEHFSTVHTSFVINFTFTNNLTLLTGPSATGKTVVFLCIKECMALNSSIVCFNYLDYQRNIHEILKQTRGKLIVIDNADILLNDEARKYISTDGNNQYLIIGRNPKNLFATKENLFELVSKKEGEITEFQIRPYL
ncbi:MAG: ABC transporter ATP-binding protein [Roseburia sp.]|nr:ABC transporter ATP-binding protein [Roseburia sp.]MCM1098520.1 ABC transporter ATP-binding protein [Ruminococcus flavefaciens]